MGGWRILHLLAAACWGTLLLSALFEIFMTGNLARSSESGGHFNAATVLFFVALIAATFASAARAYHVDRSS